LESTGPLWVTNHNPFDLQWQSCPLCQSLAMRLEDLRNAGADRP
jgi:hypothetical protein